MTLDLMIVCSTAAPQNTAQLFAQIIDNHLQVFIKSAPGSRAADAATQTSRSQEIEERSRYANKVTRAASDYLIYIH